MKSKQDLIIDCIDHLDDPDQAKMESASEALRVIGIEATPLLIEAIKTPTFSLKKRRNAAATIGFIRDFSAIPELVKQLQNNRDLRQDIGFALSRMGNFSVQPLLDIIMDKTYDQQLYQYIIAIFKKIESEGELHEGSKLKIKWAIHDY